MINTNSVLTAGNTPDPKFSNYDLPDAQVELDITTRAEALVKYANDRGYVVEIGLKNQLPLAAGHYTQSVGVRRVRAMSVPLAVAGLSNKPIPKD